MSARFDFHIHSLLTEGELVPSEIVQRCSVLGYGGIAITDHVDQTNLEHVLGCLAPACRELGGLFEMEVLPGVELTHVHPDSIEALVERARKLGAEVVVVHGETLVEPVRAGTNSAAVNATGVDILAHPGLITVEEARLAKENNVFLELSSRKGHCLANGHVAKVAKETGAGLLLNSDAHSPGDFITADQALRVALGCGLSEAEAEAVLVENPRQLLKQVKQ
ncbi:MAG TPA: histidinol phosphate phosphatase domain-containing protein [Euryarchaeota archaeon]|nr:DNA polymerase/3'-5' exonuclease PolX [archaeon BMS3Abin16]GBE56479.1 DNA polymerase/3'-5' exonuclease PolX [archaeon BMS3Bbin16]HDH28236.1 histidinol phosphate phosphatase domain-containing protein [Euryarchaeota archaeon]HDY74796.1 histidinol phosphate phosphatase domain-containing protein [Euryarchaeota archaeon]